MLVFSMFDSRLDSLADAFHPFLRPYHYPNGNNFQLQRDGLIYHTRRGGILTSLLGKPLSEILFGWGDEDDNSYDNKITIPEQLNSERDRLRNSEDEATDSSFDNISEDDAEFINKFVLNADHDKMLSKKVAEAMEADWDIQQGINVDTTDIGDSFHT